MSTRRALLVLLLITLAAIPSRAATDAYDTLRGEVAKLTEELRACAGRTTNAKARAKAEKALTRVQSEESQATAAASSKKKKRAHALLVRARNHARAALKACHAH